MTWSFRLAMLLFVILVAQPTVAENYTLNVDLKALADGKGGTIPADATLEWVKDAKGKAALKIKSNKDDTVIVLDKTEFTNPQRTAATMAWASKILVV